jgi:hypothetical protein
MFNIRLPNIQARNIIMNTAATRNFLVVTALSLSGALFAMVSTSSSSADTSAVSATWNAGSNAGVDLGANVDWSKVKQEPMSPTF